MSAQLDEVQKKIIARSETVTEHQLSIAGKLAELHFRGVNSNRHELVLAIAQILATNYDAEMSRRNAAPA